MKTKLLITGATGKTGLPLARLLAGRKTPFRALIHSMAKEHLVNKWTSDIVAGDFEDRDALDEAFNGIDKVYLLSPAASGMEKVQTGLVDSARRHGVKHVVKLSALGTSIGSPVGLLRSHARIEEHIRKSGMAWTFLHPHFFMEGLLANAGSVVRDRALYSPVGDGSINPVSVEDIAAVAAEVLTGKGHEGMTYRLTGPETVTYAEIAQILGNVIGSKVSYVPVGFDAALQAMVQAGMPGAVAEDLVRLMKTWADGKGSVVTYDVEKIIDRQPLSLREFFAGRRDAFLGSSPKAA